MTTVRLTPMNAEHPCKNPPELKGLNLSWTKEERVKVSSILGKYPKDKARSAVMPLLKLAQDKCDGWLPVDAMQLVADTVGQPYMRVYEVATFYTMFNLKPMGQFHIQVCTNCACMIRGSESIMQMIKEITGVDASGGTSQDGVFTLSEVECLGACVAAPVMQVGSHYFTHLTPEKTREILEHLKAGGDPLKYADTPNAESDPLHNGKYEEHV